MSSLQTVVVTGANSGLGFQAALHFARAGAHVVMACRNMEKAERARHAIGTEVPHAETTAFPLDVSELPSIREFVRMFGMRIGQLDVLINNAGVVAQPLLRTSGGHEVQLATNYLGAFALTGCLLPHFRADGVGRIVHVGSLAHRFGRLDVDDLNWQRTPYGQWKAYANSKLALLSHSLELNRRLRESRSNVIALAAHPGLANTELSQKSESLRPKTPWRKWYVKQMTKIIPRAALAARSVIYAAAGEGVRGGEYYGPNGWLELAGKPARARINPLAQDATLADALWTATETLTDTRYLSGNEAEQPRAAVPPRP